MMDLSSVEQLIELSISQNDNRIYATQCLDQVRASPMRWETGLLLFSRGQAEISRFFGLSLVRDFLTNLPSCGSDGNDTAYTTTSGPARVSIRNTMLEWIRFYLSPATHAMDSSSTPQYILNNVVSVVALSVKHDFPEVWPDAFSTLLRLGYEHGIMGIDFVSRVLMELDVEVVAYSDTRSGAEHAHNTAVKDAIRESTTAQDIVQFLCRGAIHALSVDALLEVPLLAARAKSLNEQQQQQTDPVRDWVVAANCMRCLSELSAWFDVTLILQTALPTIMALWRLGWNSGPGSGGGGDSGGGGGREEHREFVAASAPVRAAACSCLLELVKRGMEPVLKVHMIASIELIPQLCAAVDALCGLYAHTYPPAGSEHGGGSSSGGSNSGHTPWVLPDWLPEAQHEAIMKDLQQLGMLLDALAMELVGCWAKYEDYLHGLWQQRQRLIQTNNLTAQQASSSAAVVSIVALIQEDSQRNPASSSSSASSISSTSSPSSLRMSSTAAASASTTVELVDAAPTVVSFLDALLQKLLELFYQQGNSVITSTLFPACNRLVSLLKQQHERELFLQCLLSEQLEQQQQQQQHSRPLAVFQAERYLNLLLAGIYVQSQYPEGFDFGAIFQDELDDEVEAKLCVRKLFVNCSRVQPVRCVELLASALRELPQPLSAAPYLQLEAALRLVHAFGECGPAQSIAVESGLFPAIIHALHQSDVSQHPRAEVILNYYEISQRYLKLLDNAVVVQVLQALLGRRGVRSQHKYLRDKAPYFVYKIVDSLEESRRGMLVEQISPDLKDVLLSHAVGDINAALSGVSAPQLEAYSASASASASGTDTSTPPSSSKLATGAASVSLTTPAEQYLCEALALILSTTNGGNSRVATAAAGALHARQRELLAGVVGGQLEAVGQLLSSLPAEDLQRYAEHFGAHIATRTHALSCLARGFKLRTHGTDFAAVFGAAAQGVVTSTATLGASCAALRERCVVFLHRMVPCIGAPAVAQLASHVLPLLLRCAEASSVGDCLQLVNQLLIESQADAIGLVDGMYEPVQQKFKLLIENLERTGTSFVTKPNGTVSTVEASHIQTEKISLYRQYLLFVQHIALYRCVAVFTTPAHLHLLPSLFSVLLMGLSGGTITSNFPFHSAAVTAVTATGASNTGGCGGGAISSIAGPVIGQLPMSSQESIPLRKGALSILTGLVEVWLGAGMSTGSITGGESSSSCCVSGSGSAGLTDTSAEQQQQQQQTLPAGQILDAFCEFLAECALPCTIACARGHKQQQHHQQQQQQQQQLLVEGQLEWARHCAPLNTKDAAAQSVLLQGQLEWARHCAPLNTKDAAAQSVLVEVAALLRAIYCSRLFHSTDACLQYFHDLLLLLNWPEEATRQFLVLMTEQVPLGTYKESFKRFARSIR